MIFKREKSYTSQHILTALIAAALIPTALINTGYVQQAVSGPPKPP